MGGDFAPEAVVSGTIDASKRVSPATTIVLFGEKNRLTELFEARGGVPSGVEIVSATEVIDMNDHPVQAFVKKPDSSIAVGFAHLAAGRIDGFASAGSTGAMMVGCMSAIKQIEGVIRPTISAVVPTVKGDGHVMLLDVGLNVDCKPEVLYQYGVIGSIYSQRMLKTDNPRVALLNIGEEKEKGNLVSKATYELMENSAAFNFVGNIEAKHIFTGDVADVVVCDGFVGNTILKQAEGFYDILRSYGFTNEFIDNLNYESQGGTPVLGINSTVIIGHGCSSPKAIRNMILQTEKTVEAGLVLKFKEAFCK